MPGANREGPRGILTMVCETCGNAKHFENSVPSSITCEKCGSTVFRQFATPTEPDEASISQLEEQSRSISYDDPSPPSDVEIRDIDNL